MAQVVGLYVYPIKSCGPVEVKSARLVPGGLEFDRRYMLVDARGQFLTARAEPRLLQVELSIILARGASLLARHPSMPHPLELSALGPKNAMERSVEVWRDQPRALVCQQGSAWFSGYLNQEVQLVYLGESHLRQVNPAWARVGDLVSFADGYPLLLTNLASLRALNRRLATPVEMGRFRPNVVVDTERAFEEDFWESLSLGGIPFDAPKLCDRCVMTTVDVTNLRRSKEPLATLAKFRRWNSAVWFGTNLIPRGAGWLTVGDLLDVDQVRAHPSLG